ncbi:LLM class flavin-dependent oxidoreductase [Pandoraea anhela]|uniref:Nitrilotriacetate monooxygenase n=1 Tax=Pandoraea anhela TaxID=2508295 RepID=A0A5E4WR40_9BURK|nr:LLM class flavin-dependent oxidoreductase [Pandoraea anhela]VVE27288.1 nitrilotriacetate monooxygenase [Pandoraea anhela]
MSQPARKLRLGAYMSGSGVQGDSWRHPDTDTDAYSQFARYRHYAQELERGLFDALFFFDNLFVSTNPVALAHSPGAPRWDPVVLLAGLAGATKHIGLVASVSTTYSEPYNVARAFASLDHLSGGRAGWNLVTSTGGGENFNRDDHVDHAVRYERANEFYDVVTGLWDSHADDAFPRDKATGQWADPSRIRTLDHRGKHFRVRGPLSAPRPVQGWPVIAQAGSSEAGRELAARAGELLYTAAQDIEDARAFYTDVKTRALKYGRRQEHIFILPGVSPIVGRTQAEAEAIYDSLLSHRDPAVVLNALTNYASLGIDLGSLPFDAKVPLPDHVPETNSHKSRQKLLVDWIRREQPTVRELYTRFTGGGHRVLVGTPQSIADDFQHWFETGAADGFNIMFPSAPVGITFFVDLVVPELQRRGLFRTQYEGRTFRENLGVPAVPNRHFPPRDVAAAGGAGALGVPEVTTSRDQPADTTVAIA